MPETTLSDYNFTPRAQQIMATARRAWEHYGGGQITPEHIAEGFVELTGGIHHGIWTRTGFDIAAFQKANHEWMQAHGQLPLPTSDEGIYSVEVAELLRRAKLRADSLHHTYLGTDHMFLALLDKVTPITELLDAMGFDRNLALLQISRGLDPKFDSRVLW